VKFQVTGNPTHQELARAVLHSFFDELAESVIPLGISSMDRHRLHPDRRAIESCGGTMGLAFRSLLCAPILLGVLGVFSLAQATHPPATLVIDAIPTVKLGSTIDLKITLANVSSKGIIGNFEDVSHSELNYDVDVRDAEGNSAVLTPYMKAIEGLDQDEDRRYLVRTHLGVGGYLVKPGEKIVGNADLTQLYVLKPGTYSVQVLWWEHYARYRNPQQSRPAAGTVVVKSNVIYVKIID
jgi:hypothetical protein